MPTAIPIEQRFWPKVERKGADDCWPWLASLDTRGYGAIGGGPGKTLRRAHRVAFELANGPLLPGQVVCHRCDNRKCCNPAHLFVGTQRDNIMDMLAKERRRTYKAEGNPNAKLNHEQAAQIKAWSRPRKEALAVFGIGPSVYNAIRRGEAWADA